MAVLKAAGNRELASYLPAVGQAVGDPDLELVRRARNRDDEAFRLLVRRYEGRVYRTALAMSGNHATAEDLTQEVFLKLFRNLGRFREHARFATWFYRLSINTLLSGLRSRALRPLGDAEIPELADGSAQANPRHMAGDEERRRRTMREILRLPRMYREVVSLVFLQQCSYEETAEALGIPLGTMKNRLFRARKLLQERLARAGVV